MTSQPLDAMPRLKARICGLLYLACTVMGVSALMIRSSIIVRGDAATTAANILAHETLFRASAVADLIASACYIGVTAILYGLLKPVSPTVSRLAALFSLAGCAVGCVAAIFLIMPLVVLQAGPALAAFSPDQLQALATLGVKLHGQAYNIAMLNFGFYCTLLGFLIYRSTFLPRAVGVLVGLAGIAWLTDSFATVLAPAFDRSLNPWIGMPGFIGETSLMIWLLAMGLNAPKWQALASRQAVGAAA